MFKLILRLVLVIGSLLFLIQCGQSSTHRQDTSQENRADVQAEMDDLAPAEAEYSGIMEMADSHLQFQVTMNVYRFQDDARPTSTDDPTQTLHLPKLSGSMRFPTLDHIDDSNDADASDFKELTEPLGGFSVALFDFGDYDPVTHILILPYSISVNGFSQSDFGELSGTLENGVYAGTWYAKTADNKIVGTFKMSQQKSENQ